MNYYIKGRKPLYQFPEPFIVWLSQPIVWLALLFRISANMLSAMMSISVIIASVCFAYQYYWLGIFLLYVSIGFDYSDGFVARIRNQHFPHQAQLLDRIYHEWAFAFVFLGLGLGLNNIVFGLLAMVGLMTSSYVFTLKNWIISYQIKQEMKQSDLAGMGAKGLNYYIFKMMVLPMSMIKIIILLSIIFNCLDFMLILYGIFLPLRALAYIVHNYKILGMMQNG